MISILCPAMYLLNNFRYKTIKNHEKWPGDLRFKQLPFTALLAQ